VAGLIAGSFAVADETKPHGAWCLEMAYDRSRAELGPGQLLLLLAMGEAIARGDQFLNFLHGFAYYKHRWAAAQIDVVNVQLIRRASIYNVRTLLGELKRRWVARRSQHVSGATIHAHDNDGDQDESGSATCNDSLTRSRDLTAAALAYTGEGVRRLDRGMSSAYLPFDLA
jgi:hypothetical protein